MRCEQIAGKEALIRGKLEMRNTRNAASIEIKSIWTFKSFGLGRSPSLQIPGDTQEVYYIPLYILWNDVLPHISDTDNLFGRCTSWTTNEEWHISQAFPIILSVHTVVHLRATEMIYKHQKTSVTITITSFHW